MAADEVSGVSFHDFSAGGETGELIRRKDWTATPLGSRQRWSRSLNNYLSMILELPSAAIIFWGPDQIQLYNDGYSVIMGPRHPLHLGSPFRECWPEAYAAIHPWMQRVLLSGETVAVNRTLVPLTRFGFTEEAYFTFSFSPLRDDDGQIAGILQLVTEVTGTVLGERRASALHELSNQTAQAKTLQDATRLATEALAKCEADLPFCQIYSVDPADPTRLTVSASMGLGQEQPFPSEIDLRSAAACAMPELARVIHERGLIQVEDFARRFGARLPAGKWLEPIAHAFAAPITAADQQTVIAVLLGGISPRLALDNGYRGFLQLVCAQLAALMGAARAYDDERKRAEALAELDRAKTEFFSNVSHEFRTPLALILGPLEDAVQDPAKALSGDVLRVVYRNALRLLRLVNTLLDFARLEGGRLTSSFEATDLPLLTAGLAGQFQSLLASAGLKLSVHCPPMADPVYVDRAQWEKIVLNLLSNAFKFTLAGEIVVRLQESDGLIHLSVSDTGTGIPPEEIPRLFERFHRVKGARGRSFEGTGIGLALVRELARQHGGAVSVESVVDQGTTFTVSIPRGGDTQLSGAAASDPSSTNSATANQYVLEAGHWNLPLAQTASAVGAPNGRNGMRDSSAPAANAAERVLIVDDNADMREHLVRLLSPMCSVETAEDGQAALEAIWRRRPDLVLSDVMMPRLNGVELVSALRDNPSTRTVPIVLLSARAGEEAVVGGFDTGADDYLIKPFAARELIARVQSHLKMARLRRTWAGELERSNKELEAFSYSVSHDLRAPLRAIDGFSQALLEDYSSQLDAAGRRHLERIHSGARRMGQLIDDLLSLSRIARVPLTREPADLTSIVRRILNELQEREPGRRLEATIAEGLVTQADPRLVAIMLENLLGNAWKFSSKQPLACIEVNRDVSQPEAPFFVRDNGAGFDMQYAKQLFTPFQRLHKASEFEGTGIGLATVQRVVERHGGRVWAEAAAGRGATFFFTLA